MSTASNPIVENNMKSDLINKYVEVYKKLTGLSCPFFIVEKCYSDLIQELTNVFSKAVNSRSDVEKFTPEYVEMVKSLKELSKPPVLKSSVMIDYENTIKIDKKPWKQQNLYQLNQIHPKKWDFSLPTLQMEYILDFNMVDSVDQVKKFYEQYFPHIADLLPQLSKLGIYIAGGSVCRALSKDNNKYTVAGLDVDMFVVNQSENPVIIKNIELIANHIRNKCFSARFIRTDKAFTILAMDNNSDGRLNIKKYQIILRKYENIAQVIHGFDLGSSAVLYDGYHVYFTDLAKFAYEYSCNVFLKYRRSTSYEYRIQKYINRCFKFIMPDFDVNVPVYTPTKYGYDLCMIKNQYYKLRLQKPTEKNCLKGEFIVSVKTDYDNSEYFNNEIAAYYNTLQLINGTNNFVYTCVHLRSVIDGNADIIKIGIDTTYEMAKSVLSKPIIKNSDYAWIRYFYDSITLLQSRLTPGILDKLISDQKLSLDKKPIKVEKINLLKTNPGTQVSGSFNPIIKDVKDWYGEYYNCSEECEAPVEQAMPIVIKTTYNGKKAVVAINYE
jgi:hypothetical protein